MYGCGDDGGGVVVVVVVLCVALLDNVILKFQKVY